MIAIALGAAWVGLVVLGAWRRRPLPPTRLPVSAAHHPGRGGRCLPAPAAALGRALRRVAGRAPDDRADRWVGRTVVASVLAGVIAPPLALVPATVAVGLPVHRARRTRQAFDDSVALALPEVVDLLGLAVGAGCNVHLAVEVVAVRCPAPFHVVLVGVCEQVALGARLGDALEELPRSLGEPVRPLAAALTASDRYGAPLGVALERLAADARLLRRRRSEESARRIPVRLLFPLVLCTLPAFALLTVVPLLAGALGSLRL